MKTRIETDSMGTVEVPEKALFGAQTQRAINNFKISGEVMPVAFIRALLQVKAAAAHANGVLQVLDEDIARSIGVACKTLLEDSEVTTHFPVDVYQTGSGTSTNMNANEVIATLAARTCGQAVSPNDHVNCGQSSNDVIPTTIHVSAAIGLQQRLLPALDHLVAEMEAKAELVDKHTKTGRTHLMDAMPVTLGQVLRGWAAQIEAARVRLTAIQPALQSLAQGGTAVGTGLNAHPEFATKMCSLLSSDTGLQFTPAPDYFAQIGAQDTAVALSGLLKALAVSVMKIANDLRWMNSGPLAGLGEITLEALQPGSSIMPGKVNPVIPEAAAMVAAQVMGNDTTIAVAGQSGNFELNVMLPVIARNLLESIDILANVLPLLADRAIRTFEVNEDNLRQSLQKNPILVTALNPVIGYAQAAEIAKAAYRQDRAIIDVALDMTDLSRAELEALLNPEKLARG